MYKFDPMDFETRHHRKNSKRNKSINLILWILKQYYKVVAVMDSRYKFDPMDFETHLRKWKLRQRQKYKFDPMDFETHIFIAFCSCCDCINLILWILKQMVIHLLRSHFLSINLILWILKRNNKPELRLLKCCINLILWILKRCSIQSRCQYRIQYKFDPMDFETKLYHAFKCTLDSINLILWILKRLSASQSTPWINSV